MGRRLADFCTHGSYLQPKSSSIPGSLEVAAVSIRIQPQIILAQLNSVFLSLAVPFLSLQSQELTFFMLLH